jgi:hypothetical protein
VKILVEGESPADSVNVTGGTQSRVIEVNVGSVFSVNGQAGNVTIGGLTDWINVTLSPYSAAGNGITDDTAALQAAINACPVGGTVYLPRGVYKTTATLDLKNGVTLRGAHANMMVGPGMGNADYPCYIQPDAGFTGTSVIQIIGDDDGTHPNISGEQHLIDLALDGSLLGGSGIDGLYARGNVQNVVLNRVCIRQMPNNGIVTASRGDGTYPYSWRLRHVMVDQCHANGILFTGNTDLTLDDVQVIGCWAQGIVLENCTNGQLVGCRTEWNGNHGYRITGAWGDWQGSGGMQMTGCSTDRNGQHGVLIDATGNTPIVITGLMTRRDGRNGGAGGGAFAGLAVIGATVPVTIDGVTCYPGVDDAGGSTNSPQYGARFSGSSTVMLDNAILHADTAGLLDDGTNTLVSYGANLITVAGATTETTRTLSNPYKGVPAARYVVASDAPAREKARADYLCDGTADNVQIQAAIDAAKADGGGIVQLSVGLFNLAATLTISGNTDEDDADSITLRGVGQQATTLKPAINIDGINLTDWCVANITDLGIVAAGTGSCLTSTATLSGNEVSFWHSSFRNLRLNGYLGAGSTSGWAMDLAMPWRSVFDNIEVEGMANGMRLSNQGSVQNAGDCTFTRMFIEIVGDGHTAIQITGTGNNMNQNNFNMVEIGANGSGCTGILIDGTAPASSQRFWGLNAEQFQTTVNVAKGDSCVFDCNYVTGDSGDATNKMFVCADGSYNNTFSAKKVNINSAGTLKIIEDNNDTSNAPNIFERIRIENNATGTVTYSKRTNTVLRDITTFNTGNAMPAGLLQYPLSTVNSPAVRPDDHGLITWTDPPASLSGSGFGLTAGQVYLSKFKVVDRATVISNIKYLLTVAQVGGTAGQNFVGLYNSSGTLLIASGDQTTNFSTTGEKTAAITPQTLAVGSYYVAFLANHTTTAPSVAGGGGNSSLNNFGLTAGNARFLNTSAGNTTLPASITLASHSVNNASRWAGLT